MIPPAVLLAAGESSRFWPLSTHGHKSLHRLAGKAIIEHTVESLASAGVTEIIIVQSPIARAAHFPHRTIEDQLGDGNGYGVNITYIEQLAADGPGPALRLAAEHLNGDFFTVFPESINGGEVVTELLAARGDAAGAVAGQRQDQTWLFGVFEIEGGRVVGVVEKPPAGTEPSQICNTGVHLLNQDYLDELRRHDDGESANLAALEAFAKNHPVRLVETKLPFFPLKYPWHLFAMGDYLIKSGPYLGTNVTIDPTASVGPGCILENDVTVGPNVRLERCLIGGGSRIESSLADTILGADVTVAPEAIVQNVPLDEGHVSVDVKGHLIDTALPAMGTTVGQGSAIHRNAAVAAGVLIGAEASVVAGRRVTANVPDRASAGD